MNPKLDKKIKLIFFTCHLECTGASKVMATLLNNIDRNKFDVSLILTRKRGIYLNKGPEDVKINSLINEKELLVPGFKNLKKIYRFYKIINHEKPDVVVSFLNGPGLISILTKNRNILIFRQKISYYILQEE